MYSITKQNQNHKQNNNNNNITKPTTTKNSIQLSLCMILISDTFFSQVLRCKLCVSYTSDFSYSSLVPS